MRCVAMCLSEGDVVVNRRWRREIHFMKYRMEIVEPHNAGDSVCFLSACRDFARKTGSTVFVNEFEDVVEAYCDKDYLRFGKDGMWFCVYACKDHRNKKPEQYGNYYGTFLSAMGIHPGGYPKLDLPVFPRMDSYSVIQPFSQFAENPPLWYIQGIVDIFKDTTGEELYAIGLPNTPKNLNGVRYDLLSRDLSYLMQVIQNSKFVMTPRSLSAHVAAGYDRPSFVWCPDDGENWHLDYPDWRHKVVLFQDGLREAKNGLMDIISKSVPVLNKSDVLEIISPKDKPVFDGQKRIIDRCSGSYWEKAEKAWGVTVSVGYGDCLEKTLPFNAPHFEGMVVMTTPMDNRTINACRGYPNVRVIETDLFYRMGAKFNKGAVIEMGLRIIPKGKWCLILDADICLPQDSFLVDMMDKSKLYGANRFIVETEEQLQKAIAKRNFDVEGLVTVPGDGINGFFQLFNLRCEVLDRYPWYGIRYANASWCDSEFEERWAVDDRVKLPINLIHLGDVMNWDGSVEGAFPRSSMGDKDKIRKERGRVFLGNSESQVWREICHEIRRIEDMRP